MRALLVTQRGWVTVDADGRHAGEGAGLHALLYFDPDEHSFDRTIWHAEDLPWLRAPAERG